MDFPFEPTFSTLGRFQDECEDFALCAAAYGVQWAILTARLDASRCEVIESLDAGGMSILLKTIVNHGLYTPKKVLNYLQGIPVDQC
jgi:hypothetical protein